MALHLLFVCLLSGAVSISGQRWSRQISPHDSVSDWVPLPGPVHKPDPPKLNNKRQVAEPRILAEPAFTAFRPTGFDEPIPPRNYYTNNNNNKLYLQSFPAVPSAPQNYLTDNGFGHIRFGVGQPNNPLNQGFITSQFTFPHEIPPNNQIRPTNPVAFPKIPISSPISHPAKPFGQLNQFMKPPSNKFVDTYRPENPPAQKKKPVPTVNNDKVKTSTSERFPVNKPKLEREEVQLLYVPADTLNQGQFNFKNSIAQQVFNPNAPSQQAQVRQNFDNRPKITDNFGPEYFSGFNAALGGLDQTRYSTNASPFPQPAPIPTTPKPKKLKPHQPPLAIFVTDEARKGNQVKVGDVLSYLKSSNTIAVLDSVNPQNAPKVFIGPNNLNPPSHYVKFEVPYLSNIEHTDKKLRQLPFFVAPLSYHTPQGFAKIPFPSPHVGSVIINAQVKDSSQLKALPEPSTAVPALKQEQRPATQAPSLTYYTTSGPQRNHPPHYDKQFYSFEPQSVSTLRPSYDLNANIVTIPPNKSGNYFVKNANNDYVYQNENVKTPAPERNRETPRTSTTTTITPPPSTYPSRLLETHNPYSINQAFHLSTPLDYQKYYDEYKEGYPGYNLPIGSTPPASSSSPISQEPEKVSEQQTYQTPPAFVQNYSPEVQFQSEVPNSRYTYTSNNKAKEYNNYNNNSNKQKVVFNTDPFKPSFTNKPQQSNRFESNSYDVQLPQNVQQYSQEVQNSNQQRESNEYTYSSQTPEKTETASNNAYTSSEVSSASPPSSLYTESNQQPGENAISLENLSNSIASVSTESAYTNEAVTQATQSYNDYSYSSDEETSKTTTTTTTSTRRPLRSRGRPRYTTPRNSEYETTTRVPYTRRPVSRRPLPTRTKPDVTRPTTEATQRPTRKPVENNEVTTRSSRGRIRGRVQYKPSESEEGYDRRHKNYGSKENDLAYQRDVLHQNYPVTLSERMSTQDADYVTESLPRISSTRNIEATTPIYDSVDANTNEKVSLDYAVRLSSKEDSISYPTKTETQTENIPKSSRWEEYTHSRSSTQAQAIDAFSYDDINVEQEVKQTTPIANKESIIETVTDSNYFYSTAEEPKAPSNVAYAVEKVEDTTTADIETTKVVSQEVSTEAEPEQNVVQTTPSFSRVRVRPGVVRQYQQASTTTHSPRTKGERRRPQQAVTYRPAYDRQRTTMRIEEIENDLKTKQVHVRPEQNYKHPVYRPESSTAAPASTTEQTATKRTPNFRRRRPSFTTTTSEPSKTQKERKTELQGRFRGRRPTTETILFAETTTSPTTKNYDRKSSRLKLSERFQKKAEPKGDQDQDIDDSINRPRFVSPNNKFTPIVNPNFIYEDGKGSTTERRSDFIQETEIITASNDDYGDILLSVTPASNNKGARVLSDISPTLEALVEQSNLNGNGSDGRFETMLQDVMRSIEQMDNNEYNSTVMKLKDGEIGEIPPEKTFSDEYQNKQTTLQQEEYTTVETTAEEIVEEPSSEKPRRGYWKRVKKVRPVSTEPLEFAESQYYASTVNKFGEPVENSKLSHDKSHASMKIAATTYKPVFQFLSSLFEPSADDVDVIPDIDIPKINPKQESVEDVNLTTVEVQETTVPSLAELEEKLASPGDIDLGTGSPTVAENIYYNTPTEPTASEKSDELSFMDYLFGVTAKETTSEELNDKRDKNTTTESIAAIKQEIESVTNAAKPKIQTTESSYVPEEMTSESTTESNYDSILDEIKKLEAVEQKTEAFEQVTSQSVEKTVVRVESASESSFANPNNVVSTSMSTEVSHETEICFRGKCIKSSKDLL